VVLLGQLLARELVQHGHLLGQVLGGVEALREEHDLADLLEVRHNHGHRPEERLQVVRQLGAARVAGVHGDEDAWG